MGLLSIIMTCLLGSFPLVSLLSTSASWIIKKAAGLDTVSGNFLTHVSHKMILYVYYIYRASLRRVYFSTSWDATTVIPIPKPGKDRLLPGNYRPINYSLLSVLLKVFENSVRNPHGACECVFSDVYILDFLEWSLYNKSTNWGEV